MIFINLICILLGLCLAILSRKNSSKYKAEKNAVWAHFLGMGEYLQERLESHINMDSYEKKISALRPSTKSMIRSEAKRYIANNLAVCIAIILAANLLGLICVCIRPAKKDSVKELVFERDGYDGKTKEVSLTVKGKDTDESFVLKVSPREYTEEEFLEKSQKMLLTLPKEILGANEDLENIRYNLKLPSCDVSGTFIYEWKSSNPDILSSQGMLNMKNISEDIPVELTLTISYKQYITTTSYSLTVKKPVVSDEEAVSVINQLRSLEENSRHDAVLEIPSVLDDYRIYVDEKETGYEKSILLLGIVLVSAFLVFRRIKLKESCDERRDMLIQAYPEFVDMLWLLLGTGMTIRAALKTAAFSKHTNPALQSEIEYVLNKINAGEDEAGVYEQLGDRLSGTMYEKLMYSLSQNIKKGNSDIRQLMQQSAREAVVIKKEYIRKKGEEASAKLVFPMVLLLATVILIIIAPALLSF